MIELNQEHFQRGQRFVCVGWQPHVTRTGEASVLALWAGRCRKCGRSIQVASPFVAAPALGVHCNAHKARSARPPRSTTPKRGGNRDARREANRMAWAAIQAEAERKAEQLRQQPGLSKAERSAAMKALWAEARRRYDGR